MSPNKERYNFTAYGVCTVLNADFSLKSGGTAYDWTVLYTGRELDWATGLYYFRARYYHAVLGLFISRDPIESDLNPYRYCVNMPLTYIDPFGYTIIVGATGDTLASAKFVASVEKALQTLCPCVKVKAAEAGTNEQPQYKIHVTILPRSEIPGGDFCECVKKYPGCTLVHELTAPSAGELRILSVQGKLGSFGGWQYQESLKDYRAMIDWNPGYVGSYESSNSTKVLAHELAHAYGSQLLPGPNGKAVPRTPDQAAASIPGAVCISGRDICNPGRESSRPVDRS